MRSFIFLLLFNIVLVFNAQVDSYQERVDSIYKEMNNALHDSDIINNYFNIQKITKIKNEKIYFEVADKIDSICQFQLKKNHISIENKFFTKSIIELHNSVAKKYMDVGENNKALKECQTALKFSNIEGMEIFRSESFNVIGLIYIELNNYELSIENFNKSISIRRKINDLKGIAGSLNNIGIIYYNKHDYENAIDYFKKSLKISEENNDKDFASNTLNNIGVINRIKGDYVEAIKYYNKSIQLNIERGKEKEISTSLSNIGAIHLNQGNVDKAIEYFEKCLKIEQSQNKRKNIANTLNNIALCYKRKGLETKSIEYHKQAQNIFEEIDDKNGIAMVLNNLGAMEQDIGDSLIDTNRNLALEYYNKAMSYYKESEKLSNEINDMPSIALNEHNLGYIYLRLADYKKAIEKGESAKTINLSIGAIADLERDYDLLYEAYKGDGNFKKSLEMYEQFILIEDSIKSEEFHFEVERQEYEFEFQKKQELAKIEQSKKDELAIENNKRKNIILWSGSGFTLLIILFSLFIAKRLKHTQKQNEIIQQQSLVVKKQKTKVIDAYKALELKNKEVVDSIIYANRIQTAILPREKMIKETLKDAFIIFKPKDIVAGDFYWIEKKNDSILFAAADSTGHGVPGAIVSVICNYALNRSLKEFGLSKPSDILDKTREIVVSEFERSDEDVKDGMDIALCSLKDNKLSYSGANNPLWIIRDKKVIVVPADRQPIGKTENQKPFKNNELDVKSGDTLYIFSDGFSDQFGGDKGKKLKVQPFKNLLLSVQNESMYQQKKIIEEFFEKWKGSNEQVDDVCVIGFRI